MISSLQVRVSGWLQVSPICEMALTAWASKVQNVLKDDPVLRHLFIFRGRRGDQIKVLWADSDGLCLHQTPGAGPLRLASHP